MFYSWSDIERLGYEYPKDLVNEEMQRQDYERAVVTSEGIEIIRKQRIPDFKLTPSVKKKITQCKIFPNISMERTEKEFNNFCRENEIQEEDIIRVFYDNDRIFLVYNKEL